MIRTAVIFLVLVVAVSCNRVKNEPDRLAVAKAGDRVLYLDQIPSTLVMPGMNKTDSVSAVQSYIRRWSRKELMALRAEENLTAEYKDEVNRQLGEMRNNLLIYPVSYTHLRAHETGRNLVCRLLLEKKKT